MREDAGHFQLAMGNGGWLRRCQQRGRSSVTHRAINMRFWVQKNYHNNFHSDSKIVNKFCPTWLCHNLGATEETIKMVAERHCIASYLAELNMGSNLWNQAINDGPQMNRKKNCSTTTSHNSSSLCCFRLRCILYLRFARQIEGLQELNRRWKYKILTGRSRTEEKKKKKTIAVRTPYATRDLFIWFHTREIARWVGRAEEVPKHSKHQKNCQLNSSLSLFKETHCLQMSTWRRHRHIISEVPVHVDRREATR